MVPDIGALPRFEEPEVESTMTWARRELDRGVAPGGAVFSASHQTNGRGRLAGRRWADTPGSSVLLTVGLPASIFAANRAGATSLRAGYAVARTVDRFLSLSPAQIKWPNDVLVAGAKIAGILLERTSAWLLVGIGINVGQRAFVGDLADRATSLALLGAESADPAAVLETLLEALRAAFELAAWRSAVEERLAWRGERCRFRADAFPNAVTGVVDGIAEDGALVVRSLRHDAPDQGSITGDLPDPWLCYSGEIVPSAWKE